MQIKSIHEYSYYFYEVRYYEGKPAIINKDDPEVQSFLVAHELQQSRFRTKGAD